MPRIVRCGLIQARNVLGPEAGLPRIKKAMIDKHLKLIAEAAAKKAKIVCLQEIFYGPYFCAEQETRWYHLTERIPDGPTVRLMQKIATKTVAGVKIASTPSTPNLCGRCGSNHLKTFSTSSRL